MDSAGLDRQQFEHVFLLLLLLILEGIAASLYLLIASYIHSKVRGWLWQYFFAFYNERRKIWTAFYFFSF